MEYITFIHQRENIENLSRAERKELLDKMIENSIELHSNEKKYLSKEQQAKYANQEFSTKRWVTPDEWKNSTDNQKMHYLNNQLRAAVSPELFASMDEKWREMVLLSVHILGGKFLDEKSFNELTNKEKKYYVNEKMSKTFSFYPYEIPYLYEKNAFNVIDGIIESNQDFTKAQLLNFNASQRRYYQKKLKQKTEGTFQINEHLRKFIREVISEVL